MTKKTTTRVTPYVATLWSMLNVLFVIQSFERKITNIEQNLNNIRGKNADHLKSCYEEGIKVFQGKIEEQEVKYNKLLNDLTLLALAPPAPVVSVVPELTDEVRV